MKQMLMAALLTSAMGATTSANAVGLSLNLTGNLPWSVLYTLGLQHNSLPILGSDGFFQAPKAANGYARPPYHASAPYQTGPISTPVYVQAPLSTPVVSVNGLTPAKVRHFYGFDQISNQGAGQTIAIVDAYDDPNIASDLNTFSNNFGLPTCNNSNPCFKKIYATGRQPAADSSWSLEIALDVEWAHAIAPQAKIILVEAASSNFTDLITAINVAVKNGANVVSMSFGGREFSSEAWFDSNFTNSNVSFVAAAGDSGSGVEYPAASTWVTAVGGTTVTMDSIGTYQGETAWSKSGGGISAYETEPSWQLSLGIANNPSSKRGVPDVAYNANPNAGFAVYDSVPYNGWQSGWFTVGGTSAGTPQWAGLLAIANAMRVAQGKSVLGSANARLFSDASSAYSWNYHDISSGSNGTCGAVCTATPGYDYVTGVGSPVANHLINTLVAQQ